MIALVKSFRELEEKEKKKETAPMRAKRYDKERKKKKKSSCDLGTKVQQERKIASFDPGKKVCVL